MTTRIKLDSASNRIDVYKNMPSTKPNKSYILTIEDLVIPQISDGLVLDGIALFTVRRRIHRNLDGLIDLPVPSTFTPAHCKNTAEFVWQVNEFFRTIILQSIHVGFPFVFGTHQYNVPADFAQNNGDWHTVIRQSAAGGRAQHALTMVFRPDGRLGFRFSVDALKLFVIDLTAEGRRVLGWPRRCVALDENGVFNLQDYMAVGDDQTAFNLPAAAGLQDIECFMDGSVYSHNTYRHEVVLNSSIPLERKIEFSNREEKFSVQLASYRYKGDTQTIEYDQRDKWLINNSVNVFHFETSGSTNNRYVLKHADMQNFHVRLMSRNYHYQADTDEYISKEEPYDLPKGSFWYLTLSIKPL